MTEKKREGTLPSGRKYKAVRKSGESAVHTSIVSEHKDRGTVRTQRDSLKRTVETGSGPKTTKQKHQTAGYVTKIRSGTLPSGKAYNANREGPKKFIASVGSDYMTRESGLHGERYRTDHKTKSGTTPSGKKYTASRHSSSKNMGPKKTYQTSASVYTKTGPSTVHEASKDKFHRPEGTKTVKEVAQRNNRTGMLRKRVSDSDGKKKLDTTGTKLVPKKKAGK